MEKYTKILNKAKMNLIDPKTANLGGCPIFYSSILFSLKQEWDTTIPTAGIDGKTIFINPDFFCNLNEQEQVGLLAHEVCHIGFQHITTFKLYNRNKYSKKIEHDLWNKAGDYVINLALVTAGYHLPKGGLLDYDFEGMTTHQVYCILHDKVNELSYQFGDGDIIYPSDTGTPIDNAILDKLEKEINFTLAKSKLNAEIAGENPGTIPGEITRKLEKAINPKLPFEIILANYMSSYAKDDFSFKKPNRRFLSSDIYIPGQFSEHICNLTCAFDTSGSITGKTLATFRNSIRIINEELKPEKITLLTFDTEIRGEESITDSNQIMNIKFKGGGGTELQPIINWIKLNKPEVTLIFTDGDFYAPSFNGVTTDIIWIIENDPDWTTSYGKVFHYNS